MALLNVNASLVLAANCLGKEEGGFCRISGEMQGRECGELVQPWVFNLGLVGEPLHNERSFKKLKMTENFSPKDIQGRSQKFVRQIGVWIVPCCFPVGSVLCGFVC